MITQPSDKVGLAHTRPTDQAEGGTALSIMGPVIEKAIEVAYDDSYISVGAGGDIHVGYDVLNASLTIHNVLVCLNQWTVDNQLLRYKLYGQFITVRSGRSLDQSVPLGGGIVGLDDVQSEVSNGGPRTDGVPVLMILRIPIAVNGTLPLPLHHTRRIAIPGHCLSTGRRLRMELVVRDLPEVTSEN